MVKEETQKEREITKDISKYDDRRKELIHELEQILPLKNEEGEVIGTTTINRKATLNEKGIKWTLNQLRKDISEGEHALKGLKERQKEEVEMTDELKEMKEKIDKIYKSKDVEKTKEQIDVIEEKVQDRKKSLDDIKTAIGSRLKL